MPHPLARSALLVLALTASAATGFTLGRSQCQSPFDAYRDVRARVLGHQAAQPADGALLLLGSSTLERLNPGRLGVATTNLALGGDTIVDVLARLPSEEVLTQSAGAIVLVGFNDLKQGATVEQALREYDELLAALEPVPLTLCVTLQSLSPVAAIHEKSLAARIAEFNDGVRQRCVASDRRRLADFEQSLRTTASDILAPLYVDEVHLSPTGYDALVRLLQQTIEPMPTPSA